MGKPKSTMKSNCQLKEKKISSRNVLRFASIALLIIGIGTLSVLQTTRAKTTAAQQVENTYTPTKQPVTVFSELNFSAAARQEALAPAKSAPAEIKSIDPPKGEPPAHDGVPINKELAARTLAPLPSATGPSPGPAKTFKGEFLSATSIPPDTMGAVGTAHIVNTTNDRMRIQDRNGVEILRLTLSSFWAGVTIKGAAVSAFDPKVMYDRFNSRFILISTFNAQSVNSGVGFAVSQTNDPTGLWNRYSMAADPASTATGGLWIDYPSMGFNKNWIVVNYNTFGFGTVSGYQRSDIFVLDKQAAYAGTLSSISAFQARTSTCTAPFETKLGCGFTMAPALVEDNTTEIVHLIEDWNSTAGQLRMSKITGTPAVPVLTVGTQFPQSPNSWRFNAARIGTTNNCGGTCSGGYAPQRQQSANLVSGTRLMTNDSRIQNVVFRNGSLWTTHTIMVASAPTPAGTGFGLANPDNHSAVQWWQIDPTIETGVSTPPIQRGRIEDPAANNCHNGAGGTLATAPCSGSPLNQVGEFFAYPNISVNQNNDVLIGYTKFSSLTYPSGGYSIRLAADPANTTRDQAVYRPGQANYNLGAGTGVNRQNRWGDYSAAQTDPLNDTDFWTVQQYAGTVRDFGIGLAGNWETWWALVRPGDVAPSTSGNLIISEFRLRGPQGARDEFVELYNPGSTPIVVRAADNSEGWALAFSNTAGAVTGVAVIPNGTVISAKGHFLICDNPDGANGPTVVYSLNAYPGLTNPGILVRGADSDTGWSFDLADNGGLAIFKTSTVANFAAGNRMDSVGFSGVPAGLFKEGAGLAPLAVSTDQVTIFRDLQTGTPKDTEDNASDFLFASTVGTDRGLGSRLGAPGPQNLDGPIFSVGSTLTSSLVAPCAAGNLSPNVVRDFTTVANGAFGTLDVRQRFTNNTGGNITRLRFRVTDISTLPSVADLRPLTSPDLSVANPCGPALAVKGTSLETPPVQAMGGGYNSSLSAASVTNATPLAAGASVDLRFLLGVQRAGTGRFCVIAETLPASSSQVFCFNGPVAFECPTITLSPASLPGGTVGTGYNQTVSGVPPTTGYSFSVIDGSLPLGLSLNASTGAITGTPTNPGIYSFRILAIVDGCSGFQDYTVVIACPAITLSPGTLPAGQAGIAYSQTINVLPAGTYTFSLAAGSLPSGLTLNPITGIISGMPGTTGTTTFTVKAQAASGCSGTQSYTLVIGCPTITVNPATLSNGTAGTAYSQTLSASPAGGNYTYSASGSLPPGLNLNPSTGVLSGTPTTNGSFTFTVTATGWGSCTGSRQYTIIIGSGGCPTITLPGSLPNGSVGQLYNNSVAASPAGSYSYTSTGALPPGLTLFASVGLLFGYPTTQGSYTFTITATAGDCSGSQQYTVLIGAGMASSLTAFSDFDGDGKSDLSVFRGSDGNWLSVNSSNGQMRSTSWGSSAAPYYDVTVSGDYDGDGKTDQAVFRRGGDLAGYWFIKRSSDGGVTSHFWGMPTDIPVPGDYDADGKTDIAVWRGSAGAWYVMRSSNGGIDAITWGSAAVSDVPVPGDYDGDGKTDVAVFRQTTGDWYIKRSSDGSTQSLKWGVGTDVAVPGDYDGDGSTDLAVWRASEGNWYIIESSSAALRTVSLGAAGDMPVAADYDGDGKADSAVWRASTGMWSVKRSGDNSLMSKTHGQSGDTPVMARRN
jgi:hypothetical protein